jgi:hypothetical protein
VLAALVGTQVIESVVNAITMLASNNPIRFFITNPPS